MQHRTQGSGFALRVPQGSSYRRGPNGRLSIVFSDIDIVMVAIVGAVLALVAVIVLDSMFGSL